MIDENKLLKFATEVHELSLKQGWWKQYTTVWDRHETAMALVVSELCEGLEGVRKDLMDDHLPHHKNVDVELADALIRLLDMFMAYELEWGVQDFARLVESHVRHYDNTSGYPEEMMIWLRWVISNRRSERSEVMLGIIFTLALAEHRGIDIMSIAREKFEYNKIRNDHKEAERAKKGGKSF